MENIALIKELVIKEMEEMASIKLLNVLHGRLHLNEIAVLGDNILVAKSWNEDTKLSQISVLIDNIELNVFREEQVIRKVVDHYYAIPEAVGVEVEYETHM